MTSVLEPTFKNLLKLSLEKQFQPSTFAKLYIDLLKKYPNNAANNSISPLYMNIDANYLQRDYIYEILVGSDLENNYTEFINYFSILSNEISIKDQIELLLFINQINEKFPWKNYAKSIPVLNSFTSYSKYLIENSNDSKEFNKLLILFVKLITNIFIVSKETKLNDNFIQSMKEFSEWISIKSYKEPFKLLNSYLSEYTISSVKLGFNSNEIIKNLKNDSTLNSQKKKIINEKENLNLLKIKKIIWLSQKFTVEFVKLDDKFIIDFKELLNLSNVTTIESMPTLTMELLTGILQCFQLSNSRNIHIWKEYLVCKIPWFLKYTLEISQNKFEKVIETLLSDYDPIIFQENKEIMIEFDNNLIELELLRPGIFKNINKPILSNDEKSKIYTIDDLNHNYTHKFIECNPEFTSIEEIGIVEFVNKTNNSIKIKNKFCELFMDSFNSFMLTGDTLRLRRLLISCSINFQILDNLLLHDSPYKILLPLLKFLEKQVIQTPEGVGMNAAEMYLNQSNQPDLLMDLDIAGDDSSNAQDFFSDLSTMLVFCQFIIKRYNLILNDPSFSSLPNTISLLKRSKLIVNLSDSSNTIEEVKLDDNTINKWISSMFDPSNVNGISDSLIKTNTPLEYSLLIPKIVREALICNSLGWLDDDGLMGGLEYLHQKFLVGWMVFVFEEICNLKWFNNGKDSKLDLILEKVLKQLLETNDNENIDIQVIIKLARYTVCDKINLNFPHLESSNLLKPYKSLTPIENFSNLIKFVSSTKENTEKFEFELTQVWFVINSENLIVDYLYKQLNILVFDYHLSSDLSCELITDILITFCKWRIGNSICSTWPIALSELRNNKPQDLFNLSMIFNRKPTTIVIKGYKGKDNIKIEDSENKTESGFFGFIQEPKSSDESDSNMMDVDSENKTINKGIDIYGENLILLAYENMGNSFVESFIHSILDHLS